MKIRNGFVSNSSSSSFVCNICGEVEGGYDCSLGDFDMLECEHGHTFHDCHMDKSFHEQPAEFQFNFLKKSYLEDINNLENSLDGYKKKLSGEVELQKWEQASMAKDSEWLNKTIQSYEEHYSKTVEELEKITEDFANLNDEDWLDKYEEIILHTLSETKLPEELCPVCQKLKEYKQDPEWQEYQRLKEKFNGISL